MPILHHIIRVFFYFFMFVNVLSCIFMSFAFWVTQKKMLGHIFLVHMKKIWVRSLCTNWSNFVDGVALGCCRIHQTLKFKVYTTFLQRNEPNRSQKKSKVTKLHGQFQEEKISLNFWRISPFLSCHHT